MVFTLMNMKLNLNIYLGLNLLWDYLVVIGLIRNQIVMEII